MGFGVFPWVRYFMAHAPLSPHPPLAANISQSSYPTATLTTPAFPTFVAIKGYVRLSLVTEPLASLGVLTRFALVGGRMTTARWRCGRFAISKPERSCALATPTST
jgi:hypothetical protein